MLVPGRERQYLQAFFNTRISDPAALSESDLDLYTSAYSAPGAMRAGFEVFRVFDQYVQDNCDGPQAEWKTRNSRSGCIRFDQHYGVRVEEMMREVADNVTGLCVSNAAHRIAKENPEACTTGLLRFLTSAETKSVKLFTHLAPSYSWLCQLCAASRQNEKQQP
jgi:hypothetical protein